MGVIKRTKITSFLLLISMLIAFNGCSASSTVFIGSIEKSTNTSWSNEYLSFSGHATRTITVSEGSPVEVFVSIKTDSGNLSLTIMGKDGTFCYEGKDLQTTDFSVTIDKPGDYDIGLKADKHKGGFSFNWG